MPSRSLRTWQVDGRRALDEIESAQRAVGGVGRGRRFALQQINQGYVVLLSSQFQRFCLDLHTECIEYLTDDPALGARGLILRSRLTAGRKLDSGNPNPGNIGSEFGRFGVQFWDHVRSRSPRNAIRQHALDQLGRWRNAVSHHDFSDPLLQGRTVGRLTDVRRWRRACDGLTVDFDAVMRAYLKGIIGAAPW